MFIEIEEYLKNMTNFVKTTEIKLDKEIEKLSEKDKAIFMQLKALAKQGKIDEINKTIAQCYK